MSNFSKPTKDPNSCEHDNRVDLMDWQTTDEHAIDGCASLDATEICLDCHDVRLWGVDWITPPPPSDSMKERLEALFEDGSPCSTCGALLGEAMSCNECFVNAMIESGELDYDDE